MDNMGDRTMFKRHRLEKEEGKAYNEPGVRCVPNNPDACLVNCAAVGVRQDEGFEQDLRSTPRHQFARQPDCLPLTALPRLVHRQHRRKYQEHLLICLLSICLPMYLDPTVTICCLLCNLGNGNFVDIACLSVWVVHREQQKHVTSIVQLMHQLNPSPA